MPQVVSIEKQRTRGKVHAALVSVQPLAEGSNCRKVLRQMRLGLRAVVGPRNVAHARHHGVGVVVVIVVFAAARDDASTAFHAWDAVKVGSVWRAINE